MDTHPQHIHELEVDEVQFFVTTGILLHPKFEESYIKKLVDLEHADKICIMPSVVLNIYAIKVKRMMAS